MFHRSSKQKQNTNIEWVPPDMAEHYATKYNNPFVFHLKPTTTTKKLRRFMNDKRKKIEGNKRSTNLNRNDN